MKLYSIEITGEKYKSYRFVSLYNGTRGTFCFDKDEAIMQGEDHQKIILAIHPELKSIVKENNGEKTKALNTDIVKMKSERARKEQGVKLGRPAGKGRKVEAILKEKNVDIEGLKNIGLSAVKIGKLIGVDRRTVSAYLIEQEKKNQEARKLKKGEK